MGASEGFQSLCGYSSDPVFPLFGLQLRVLGDRHEFEYGWVTFRHVALVRVFHSMSLACFLLRAFRSHFLARRTFSLCCHSLDILGYVH